MIRSIKETSNEANVEIIIKFDSDDKEAQGRCGELTQFKNLKAFFSPRLRGYEDVNLFYDQCAKRSSGDWHAMFNDDTVILGNGWDEQLKELPMTGLIVQPEIHRLGSSTYPQSEGGPVPFVPAFCWENYGLEGIPVPVDRELDFLLRRDNGWQTHWLKGITIWHDRDNDDVINEYRKL